MNNTTLFVVGAGGLGREVLAALQASGETVSGFLVEEGYPGGMVASLPVYSDNNMWRSAGMTALAIGDQDVRRRLATRLADRCKTVVHPEANIGPRVSIGTGSVLLGLANITCDVQIGVHVLINPGCVISHDCEIGPFSNLGPGVALAGRVSIGEGVSVGTGAVILPGCRVGDYATIGAGAVVVGDVATGTTVYGVPAKPSLIR